MSLQDELNAAGQEYTRHLDRQREADRLAALQVEAQHHSNASAFAAAIEGAFAALDAAAPDTAETDDLADLADAIRNDAPQENA